MTASLSTCLKLQKRVKQSEAPETSFKTKASSLSRRELARKDSSHIMNLMIPSRQSLIMSEGFFFLQKESLVIHQHCLEESEFFIKKTVSRRRLCNISTQCADRKSTILTYHSIKGRGTAQTLICLPHQSNAGVLQIFSFCLFSPLRSLHPSRESLLFGLPGRDR